MQTPVRELQVNQLDSKAGVTYTVTSSEDGELLYTVETSEYGEPQVIVTRHTKSPQQTAPTSSARATGTDTNAPPRYNEPPPPYDPPPYHSIDRTPNPTHRHSFQPTDYLVGTASFQDLSSNIDIYLPNSTNNHNHNHGGSGGDGNDSATHITMTRSNPLSMKRRFPTHTLLGRLSWKEEKFGLNGHQKLTDDHKRLIARYVNRWTRMPVREADQLLLYLPDQRLDQNLDLIVLTGLASVEYRRQSDLEWSGVARGGTGTILPLALMGTGFGFIL